MNENKITIIIKTKMKAILFFALLAAYLHCEVQARQGFKYKKYSSQEIKKAEPGCVTYKVSLYDIHSIRLCDDGESIDFMTDKCAPTSVCYDFAVTDVLGKGCPTKGYFTLPGCKEIVECVFSTYTSTCNVLPPLSNGVVFDDTFKKVYLK